MQRMLLLAAAITASVSVAGSAASTGAQASATEALDWSALNARLEASVPRLVPGLTLLIIRGQETVYLRGYGTHTADTVVPIASSTKLPSASAILTLVDRGLLDLDRPVQEYLRGAIDWPDDKSAITTRMLLNHTSGLAGAPSCLNDQAGMTLKECAQQIGKLPLAFRPGSAFSYGGGSFQVAGYVAEVVSHSDWHTLFARAITTPLGLQRFTYGPGANPRIAGGASSDAGDYAKLLEMQFGYGTYRGRVVLSRAAVDTMRANQVANLPKRINPGGETLPGYSFGWWISAPSLLLGPAGRVGSAHGSCCQKLRDDPHQAADPVSRSAGQLRRASTRIARRPAAGA